MRPALLALPLLAATTLTAAPARLALVEAPVEHAPRGGDWSAAREEAGFEFGESLRVGPEGLARLSFPWMSVTAGPETRFSLPAAGVLALRLDAGRLAVDSSEREILPVLASGVEVRGVGRVVVRAEPGRTLVMAHRGRFEVLAGGGTAVLEASQGTWVAEGARPQAPRALPPAPRALEPGEDARYVAVGEPARLAWSGTHAAAHWVELLAVRGDVVLLQREAGPTELSLRVPWPGAFRWRVAARDADGLEGLPSTDGLLSAVN